MIMVVGTDPTTGAPVGTGVPRRPTPHLETTARQRPAASTVFGRTPPARRVDLLRALADRLDDAGAAPRAHGHRRDRSSARSAARRDRADHGQLRLFAEVISGWRLCRGRARQHGQLGPGAAGVAALARAGRTGLDLRGQQLPVRVRRARRGHRVGAGRRRSGRGQGPPIASGAVSSARRARRGGRRGVRLPVGTFAVVFGDTQGTAALRDSRIKASGFTGSTRGGRALFDIAPPRPTRFRSTANSAASIR